MAVKVNLKMLEDMRRVLMSQRTKAIIGEAVVQDIKYFVSRGISPVKGQRRFDAYKDPKKYPADLKDKRPVNLELTGDMLAALKFYPANGTSIDVGVKGPQAAKARAHNEGTRHMARRPFLPTEKGESFNTTITRRIRSLYADILSDILKR